MPCYLMEQSRIDYLLKLYADNVSTKKEVEELFSLLKREESQAYLKKIIVDSSNENEPVKVLHPEWEGIWAKIQADIVKVDKKMLTLGLFKKIAAAASLILTVGAGFFFIAHKKKAALPEIVAAREKKNVIQPGGNKAVLTLADGSLIILDTIQNGYLTSQSNTKIIKLNTGLLSYKKSAQNKGEVLYNTIATPRGGQYQVQLADGTNVWLNAASSLRFPTSFSGKERRVELKGEAYFEVAKNASMPFHVNANAMDVLVVGTHFNIMNYGDEAEIKTTLLEGKIDLTANGITKKLKPGKQAVVNRATNNIALGVANIDQAMAWKNGEFRFKETPLKELMRQIGRWYDVDVEYQSNSTDQAFTASLPRMQSVSAMLQLLALTGTVHFKIDNRKIIVLP